MKKKILIASIILLAIIILKNISYGTYETIEMDEITVVNPNYNQVLTKQNVKDMIEEDKKATVEIEKGKLTYKSIQLKSFYKEPDKKSYYYYDSKTSAAKEVKNKMKNRVQNITIRYATTESNFQDVATSIVKLAISEDLAKYSDEGDYLAWSYGGYTVGNGSGYYYKDNKYYWVLNYTFTYYTTLSQEQTLNNKIQKFIKKIDVKKESQYSIIKQVNDYICGNVQYDYEHVSDPTYKLQFTAYAALIKGKAVCQGYSALYYRILKECNIQNRVIVSATHSWNIVKIGNLYYNVDTVWDDQLGNDVYFLSGTSDFIKNSDHIRSSAYNTYSFNQEYPMAITKFNVEVKQIKNLKVAKTKTNSIKFTWDKDDNISGYKIYKYNYDKNCWEYYKQIKGSKNNSCEITELKEVSICKIRVRGYATVNSDKIYGKYSQSIKTITSPKTTVIKTIKTPGTKQIKIGWKKILTGDGYQIQYSTDKNFKSNVETIKVKGKTNNYKILKNLSKNKKYYFRVRTYKWYKGQKYCSEWSEIQAKKTK